MPETISAIKPDNVSMFFLPLNNFYLFQCLGMLHELDESVGRVVEALQKVKMLDNSIIVFVSDNGGAAAGFNLNAASNWPLRGVRY